MDKPDADEKALQEPFYHQNPKYKCCGMHAKKGIIYMALAMIIFSLVLIGVAFLVQIFSLIGVAAFIILLCVLIFVGNKKENPHLYLPFLFAAVLFVIALVTFAVFLIVMLLQVPEFWRNYANFVFAHQKSDKEEETVATARIVSAVLLAASLVLIAVTIWLASITLKGYHYLKEMHIARHPHKVYYINGKNTPNGEPQEITTVVESVA